MITGTWPASSSKSVSFRPPDALRSENCFARAIGCRVQLSDPSQPRDRSTSARTASTTLPVGEDAALADPQSVALDDEYVSQGSIVGFERARVAGLIARSRRQVADLEEPPIGHEGPGSQQHATGL